MSKVLTALWILMFSNVWGMSQTNTDSLFVIGHRLSIQSEILDQERPIIIYTPRSYQDSPVNYPVLYLMDGGGNFHHTTACVEFLARNGRIPEMIVVGIPNTDDRTRDLTPSPTSVLPNFPTAGGANRTLDFIEQELMPFIEESYRVNDYTLLIGHSFGGLFAIHAWIHRPELFDAWLPISPSLWWDNQFMVLNQADTFLANHPDLNGHLFITMGNEGGTMIGGARKLEGLLEEKAPSGLQWQFKRMPEESHGSIPHRSTYDGLEYIFKSWRFQDQRSEIERHGFKAFADFQERALETYGFNQTIRPEQLLALGNHFTNQGEAEEARKFYSVCSDSHPTRVEAWIGLGQSLVLLDRREEAIEALNTALSLQPENRSVQIHLAELGVTMDGLSMPTLSNQELAQYEGDYVLNVGLQIRFTLEDGYLWGKSQNDPPAKLTPIGPHQFFAKTQNTEITFLFKDEKVTGFRAQVNGQTFTAEKNVRSEK